MSAEIVNSEQLSVDQIIANLMGIGIEEFHEPINLTFKGRVIIVKLENIPSETERLAIMALGDAKGYEWMQQVKLQMLSRAITWIDGIDIKAMGREPKNRLVIDPYDGIKKDVQVVLLHLLDLWGQETVQVLWKILMVHAQSIEDRLVESLPDSAIMTDVERRINEKAAQDIADMTEKVIRERTEALIDEDLGIDELIK